MDAVCRKCGHYGFYLQQHGMQIGMYCENCGAWLKWVGKKDLEMYKRRGLKVFDQNARITLKEDKSLGLEQVNVIPQNNTFETNSVVNFGLDPAQISSENQDSFDIDAEVERRVSERLKNLEKKQEDGKKSTVEKVENEEVGFCPVCDGNPLVSEGQSRVEVSIFSGVMTITDPDGLNIYGLYKLKRCPYCGKLF